MYIDATLLLTNYVPKQIEKGMLFQTVMSGVFEEKEVGVNVVWVNEETNVDRDEYIAKYGLPVSLYLESEKGEQLAEYEHMGWVDVGVNEQLVPLTIEDINIILSMDGQCQVDCDKTVYVQEGTAIPIYVEGKVVIRYY